MLRTVAVLLVLATPVYGGAPSSCPAAVTTSIGKAFPSATIGACKAEREHGKDQFEVKLTTAGSAPFVVDAAPDGTILQVEETIAIDALPAAVKKAFAAKYPQAKADRAEKQTAGKDVRYEIAFSAESRRKEATFAADGRFVEEE